MTQEHRPSPERPSPASTPDRLTLLRWRQADDWHKGQARPVEFYLTGAPGLGPEEVLVLIVGELMLRRQFGERPELADYQRRFPHLAADLADQFELAVGLDGTRVSSGAASPLAVPAPVGLPGYEVLGELGRGGMGVIYRARQAGLNRVVALKMILAGAHAGDEERRRFLAEAETIARVRHPGIVQVYDCGTHEGLPYFSMEFCDGGSLAEYLGGTPLPPAEAAQMVEQVALAVQAAHAAGVVHRDLKPGNVLLTRGGSEPSLARLTAAMRPALADLAVKVTDFGLAKRVEGGGATRTGNVMGTPSYMPPEQARGEKDVGPPADVYSLGAILYECLTGRPPFKAATQVDTLLLVIGDEPVPVRRLQAGVPADLETICHKCLQKDAARRYQSAAELAEDLRRWREGRPIVARPIGRAERGVRWCRRNPLAATVVVLLGFLFGGAVTALVVIAAREAANVQALSEEQGRTQEALEESLASERKALQALRTASQAEREKTEKLWDSYLIQARARRTSGLTGQRFGSLKAIADAAKIRTDLRLRNEAIACLALPDLRITSTPFAVPRAPHRVRGANRTAVAPATGYTASAGPRKDDRSDSTGHVATLGDRPKSVLVRDREGKLLHTLEHPLAVETLHWRCDGKYLVVGSSESNLYVWEFPGGRLQSILEGQQSGTASIEFSNNGGLLATTSYDGTSRLWDPIDGRVVLRSEGTGPFYGPFSADDRQLGNMGHTLEFADGRECRVLHHGRVGRGGSYKPDYSRGPWECSFSPDGRILATGIPGSVILWDTETGEELNRLPSSTGGVAFEPNGTLWVTGKGGVTRWPLNRQEGEKGCRSYGPPTRVPVPGAFQPQIGSRFAISRDGRFLLGTDMLLNRVHVVRTNPPGFFRTLEQPRCMHATISPDGKLAVASSYAWQPHVPISVYEVETGRRVHEITQLPFGQSAFSPDGSLLVTSADRGTTVREVGTWKAKVSIPRASHLPGRVDCSPDGRMIAIMQTNFLVLLVESGSGKEIATLMPPEPGLICCIRFGPTGSHLAVLTEANRVFLWDIRAIRQQLREMNLDWDHPAPEAPPKDTAPLRVRIQTK